MVESSGLTKKIPVVLTVEDNNGVTATDTADIIVTPLEKEVKVSPGLLELVFKEEQYASMKISYNWIGLDEITGEDLYVVSEITFSTTGIVGLYELFITR